MSAFPQQHRKWNGLWFIAAAFVFLSWSQYAPFASANVAFGGNSSKNKTYDTKKDVKSPQGQAGRTASSVGQPAAPGALALPPEAELGPVEDIPATATAWLLQNIETESLESAELGEGLRLAAKVRIGDAEVYILESILAEDAELPIMNLQDAQKQGLVNVRELTQEEYKTLGKAYPSGGGGMVVAENKSDVYVMVIGGEVLEGGHQDRMIASSAILPPHSSGTPLPVNCVERNRSKGSSDDFKIADVDAHPMLRALSLCRADQQGVWNEVARVRRREGITQSPTETYMLALNRGKNRQALSKAGDALAKEIAKHPRATGLVFAWRGKVVSMERFASPKLFKGFESSILYSHLLGIASWKMESASAPKAGAAAASGKTAQAAPGAKAATTRTQATDVVAFLESVAAADRLRPPLNHQGSGVALRSPDILGGEILTNIAPKDPGLKTFASDLAKHGPAPEVLHSWAVRLN